jgi:hypothetical protein
MSVQFSSFSFFPPKNISVHTLKHKNKQIHINHLQYTSSVHKIPKQDHNVLCHQNYYSCFYILVWTCKIKFQKTNLDYFWLALHFTLVSSLFKLILYHFSKCVYTANVTMLFHSAKNLKLQPKRIIKSCRLKVCACSLSSTPTRIGVSCPLDMV